MNDLEVKTCKGETQTKLAIGYLTAIAIIAILFIFPSMFTWFTAKIQKKNLVQLYGVDTRTFKKWLAYLYVDGGAFLSNFQSKRKLDLIDVSLVIFSFGLPEDFESIGGHPVMSKKQVVNIGEGTYRSLRQSIASHPEEWNITLEAYGALSVFPPAVSAQLKEVFG